MTDAVAAQDKQTDIYALIAEDMSRVDDLIQKHLHSDVELIDRLGHYIVNGGGKRLRPSLLLISAGVFNYRGDQHINLAAIIEFIHTATLLHDDVVDASLLRRGRATANQRWGNEASVLVGDFVYSRAFQMMIDSGSMRVMEILADTTNTIATGEVQQLINTHNPDTTEDCCLGVICKKTAKLFEAAARLGAVISNRPNAEECAIARYGRHLGTTFQLIDDALDYSSSSSELGKNIGDDLADGNPTLPLLYAMWHSSKEESRMIRTAIEKGGMDDIEVIQGAIKNTGAIEYTEELAKKHAQAANNALSVLPESKYLQALYDLAQYSLLRQY